MHGSEERYVRMKILVLGGTGVISRQIVKQAVQKGYDVTMFNRGSRKLPECEGAAEITGDRKSGDFASKFDGMTFDTVIDMISFNAEDARQTIEVFSEKAKQIIITSTVAAYDRPYQSWPVREEAETLRTDPAFGYGYHKAELERYLQTQIGKIPAAVTIIRPSLTFGEGAANFGMLRQNRNVVRRIREGKPVVMIGEGCNPWVFTFAKDLASAYVLACGNENTYQKAFHVTADETVTWEDLYRAVGKAVGREPVMVNVPTAVLKDMLPNVCAHLFYEKRHFNIFDTSKFKEAVPAYHPQVSLEDGVKELVDWWEKTGFPYDEKMDLLEDQICAAWQVFHDTCVRLVEA